MSNSLKITVHPTPGTAILQKADAFLRAFTPLEISHELKLLLHFDEKSNWVPHPESGSCRTAGGIGRPF
jgi:hypothetical protein